MFDGSWTRRIFIGPGVPQRSRVMTPTGALAAERCSIASC
jgi:hypothetical protein